uniref:Uncharacterized protein n=1 Tax=Hanusia phi TaxID=3032 RepID=A0A7S0NCQ9_9CRYP|mmetsp:Transcript_6561/g.14983  ORF Transcript_6561/g.14983 Transcript_6561/m.14983 type:complete len:211 (+) Transcript_6561:47-679(+)
MMGRLCGGATWIVLFIHLVPSPSTSMSCAGAFEGLAMTLRGGGEVFRGTESSGMEMEEQNVDKGAFLRAAAQVGDFDMMQMVLLEGAAVNDADPELQCTALHYAARYGDVRCVDLLIEKGADVNAATRSGFKPIHYASAHGWGQVVNALVSAGADIDDAVALDLSFDASPQSPEEERYMQAFKLAACLKQYPNMSTKCIEVPKKDSRGCD